VARAGALPPNLLRAPGFEQGAAGWQPLGRSRYSVVQGAGCNGSAGLRYRKDAEGEGRENSHHDQIVAVEPGKVYVAGAWFRAEGTLRPILRIATMEWQDVALAAAGPSRDWQLATATFRNGTQRQVRFQIFGGSLSRRRESAVGTSTCDDAFLREATEAEIRALHRCQVSVDAAAPVRAIDPRFFGVNTLFMADDDAALADGTIARHLKAMPCRLLRYPGGDMADNYLWKTHSLDDAQHWPRIQGPQTTDTDEFMALCRQVGAEAIFVVNLESGFVHGNLDQAVRDAADWVAHCNRTHDYGVRLWEIGNETYLYSKGKHKRVRVTAEQYGRAFVRFARAMKAVDPSIRIGAIGPMSPASVSNVEGDEPRRAWWPAVVEAAGGAIDFAVVHQYFGWGGVTYERVAASRITVGERVGELKAFLRGKLGGREVPVALTEWNIGRHGGLRGMASVLIQAELVASYITGGVDMATFWPLRLPGKGGAFRALLDRETHRPLPAYQGLRLFATHTAERLVRSEASKPQVVPFATASADGARLVVFLINKSVHADGFSAELSIRGFEPDAAAASALTAPGLESDALSLGPLDITRAGETWACRLPPHSIVLVTFTRQPGKP